MAKIELPSPAALGQLADRVRFTDAELAKLGIMKEALTPYILAPDEFPYVSDRPIGDTPLRVSPAVADAGFPRPSQPCQRVARGQIGSHHDCTERRDGRRLSDRNTGEAGKVSENGHFWPVPALSLPSPNRFFMRASVVKYERGRYLQVIQIPNSFEDFPRKAFASVHPPSSDALKFLSAQLEWFWDFTGRQEDVRATTTVLLLSGWGGPQQLSPPIDENKVPANWQFLVVSFEEAYVMGVVPDMRLGDVLRVMQQQDRLVADGFEFRNINGSSESSRFLEVHWG